MLVVLIGDCWTNILTKVGVDVSELDVGAFWVWSKVPVVRSTELPLFIILFISLLCTSRLTVVLCGVPGTLKVRPDDFGIVDVGMFGVFVPRRLRPSDSWKNR